MTVTGDGTWLRPPSSSSSTLHAAARSLEFNVTGFTADTVSWDDDLLDTDGFFIDTQTIEIPVGLSGWYVLDAEIIMSLGDIADPATHHQAPEAWLKQFHAIGSTTTFRSEDTFYQPLITDYTPNSIGGVLHMNTGVVGASEGDQFWVQVDADSAVGETLTGGDRCHFSILKVG